MAVYGYGRCSTNEDRQDITRQIRELQAAGVPAENVYFEYEHGTAAVKPQLDRLLMNTVTAGDTIVTTEVSRLSRSTQQLCEIIGQVREKRIRLQIIGSITIDCRTGELDAMSAAFVEMAGVFAELERNLISTRVKSGVENARAKGKRIGRPPITVKDIPPKFLELYPRIKRHELNKSEASKVSGFSRVTIDRYIHMLEQ